MKGKHAARAARRTAETTAETIGSLSASLAEAKDRARRNELTAARLPAAEKEIRRLRAQVEAGASDNLAREQNRAAAAEIRLLDALGDALDLVVDVVERLDAPLTYDEWEKLRTLGALIGESDLAWLAPELAQTRGQRRAALHRFDARLRHNEQLKPGEAELADMGRTRRR